MQPKQLTLFEVKTKIEIHDVENNLQSQAILEKNKIHFSKQCMIIYNALISGYRLTTSMALIGIEVNGEIHKIGDLRRRIKDLKDNGIKISEQLNKDRYKVWYMSDEDKKINTIIL